MASPPSNGAVDGIASSADAIRLARALVEERFLALGRTLEDAADRLDRLTGTFRSIAAEFDGEALKHAARELTDAAGRVTTLAGSYRAERGALGGLVAAAADMDERVQRMHRAIKAADVLGVSAKIEAMHIGPAGADFVAFAEEIDRSLKLSQSNLAELAREIAGVRGHLEQAEAAERCFEAQHADALAQVPRRLAAGVARLAAHHQQAAGAGAAVAERSQRVGLRVGEAVMALQIGDVTRQRIEHVEQALALLDGEAADGAPDGTAAANPATRIRRLLSAQLADTAGEFDQEVARIFASLRELAANAGDIAELGRRAYGDAAGGGDSFLHDLRNDVTQAASLLGGFAAARRNADAVVGSVQSVAASLAAHVGTIRSLEADIRIMGLNTTLKCGRLGTIGRPLAVIAQELRACANVTAVEAGAVMAGLGRMTRGVETLSGDERARRSADIMAVAEIMDRAIRRLGDAGTALAGALGALDGDGTAIRAALADTAAHAGIREEIGSVLRRSAAELEPGTDGPLSGAQAPAETALLERIRASYTMKQERTVHARALGTPEPADLPPRAVTTAEAALDDILF